MKNILYADMIMEKLKYTLLGLSIGLMAGIVLGMVIGVFIK